jgi:competence protein ComEC
MRSAILGFTAGVLALQTSAALPSHALMLACLAAALALTAVARKTAIGTRSGAARACIAACAGTLLGYAWAAFLAHSTLAPQLNPADEGRDLTITGVVDSLPYRFEQGLRFNLQVERTETPNVQVPPRIALSWYADRRGEAGLPETLMPGERWRLTVRLQRPHGNVMWNGRTLRSSLYESSGVFHNHTPND